MLSIGGSTTVNFMVYGVCLALVFPVVDSCFFRQKLMLRYKGMPHTRMCIILGINAVFLNLYAPGDLDGTEEFFHELTENCICNHRQIEMILAGNDG